MESIQDELWLAVDQNKDCISKLKLEKATWMELMQVKNNEISLRDRENQDLKIKQGSITKGFQENNRALTQSLEAKSREVQQLK